MAVTPLRNVRVPDELWNAAMDKARARWPADYLTLSGVIIRALESYVRGETIYGCGHDHKWHVEASAALRARQS